MNYKIPEPVRKKAGDYLKLSTFIAGRYIVIILDDEARLFIDGKTLSLSSLEKAARVFSSAGNARDLFEIPEKRLSAQFAEKKSDRLIFPGRTSLLDMEDIGYTSDYPNFNVIVFPLMEGYYLGVVRFPRLEPHFIYSFVHIEVYTDEEGLIRGFNAAFAAQTGGNADELLGRPLNDLLVPLTPSPGPALAADRKGAETWTLEKDMGPAFEWRTGPSRRKEFRETPFQLRMSEKDYRFDIIVAPGWTQLPGLVLTGSPWNPDFPDARGYHAGLEATGDDLRATIKRLGQIMAFGRMNLPPKDAEARIEIRKTDRWLACEVNGTRVVDFLEWDEIVSRDPVALLSLLPGFACRVESVRFWSSPRSAPSPETAMQLVRLRGATDAVYHLRRLSQAFEGRRLFVYQLINMSDYDRLHRQHEALREERKELRSALSARQGPAPFLGESDEIKKILSQAARVASQPLTVTLEGETGTGKEVLAETLHRMSDRRDGPFIKVDCTAFPASLMESELFGHEKGAFTGASERRAGRLEQANGGTLFLDEISNLPLELQAKLLDFLQTFHITRLGGSDRVPLDVRVVVASNRPLGRMVQEGRFREDLWYRINSVVLRLPPLKDRREDIPVLIRHFIGLANRSADKKVTSIEAAAARRLFHHDWPGNVRELRNVIFAAVFNARGDRIRSSDVTFAERPAGEGRRFLRRYSKAEIEEAVKKCHGNIRRAAFELNIGRATIYRKLKVRD